MSDFTPIPAIERFVEALGSTILHVNDDCASYTCWTDTIRVPPRSLCSAANYYTLLLHEHAHWTRHPTRLDRIGGRRTTDALYAREELTAITANLHLCAFFGLPPFGVPCELAYARTYLPNIEDSVASVRYAVHEAHRAVLYLHERQGHGAVQPEAVLFRSVDALAVACFSAMAPEPSIEPAPKIVPSPLAPLIARFGVAPRLRFA